MGEPIKEDILYAIIQDLEESSLPIYFDIVDFHGVSERMQKEIMKDGVLWQK